MSLVNLAVIARDAGQLGEAERAMQRGLALAHGLRLRASDRASFERTMAVIDFDLGHYAAARDRLAALVGTTDGLEHAIQLRILANVYAELGDGAAALRSAEAAIAAVPKDYESAEAPFSHQARARALAVSGHYDEALTEIDGVLRAFADSGRSPEAYEVLRALRYRAEFLLGAGRAPESLSVLRDLEHRHRAGKISPTERGLMLDALGQAEALAGDVGAAREAHRAAQVELTKQLSPGHPYLVHNAALLAGA